MDKLISTKRLYEKVSEIEEIIKNRLVHLGTEDPFYQVHLAQFNDWTAFKKMIFDEPEVKDGKLLELPCKPGDTVYVITECNYIKNVLDGTLYDSDGSPGTATGYYCPYYLNEKCPHDFEDFDDCDDCKNEKTVFEDCVSYIQISEDGLYVICETTGFIGKIEEDVFLTEQGAQAALEGMKHAE